MVGLIDIAPAVETVDVQGSEVAVTGVSAKGLAHLLGRFPELRMLMTGREVEAPALMAMGGDAVAAIIAAGCGYPGDEQAETVAGKLSLDTQADLLAAILRLTLPKGIGPFVEKLTALGGSDATTFDPSALSGSGYVYNLLLNPPVQPYDLGMFYSFSIPVDGSELLQHVAARSFVVPGDFMQSVAFLRVAATTQSLTLDLYKNDDVIGHLEFVPGSNATGDGGQFGTFIPLTPADDVQFDHGDRFKTFAPDLSPPTPDDTAAGLSITIAARTGTIS